MATNEQIINEAQEYISNNLSVAETSKKLGICKKTFQLHMKALEIIDNELYTLVKNKQDANQVQGRVKGGTIGKRTTTWTKEEAEKIADAIIMGELTYERVAQMFDIPSSTIFEMMNSGVLDEKRKSGVDRVIEAHKKQRTLAELQEEAYLIERKYM